MADKDLDKANSAAPAADIPDLKKKEKERKKAGAAWGSSGTGGSPFGGATGGAGAAARSAASAAASAGAAGAGGVAAGGAAVGGGAFSGLAGWLSGVLATTMGKAFFALGALLMLGGGGLLALGLMGGSGAGGGIVPDLGGLSSSLKIDRGGADRTAIAGKGEIRFDPLQAKAAPEPKKEEAPVEEKTAEAPADAMEPGTINDTLAGKDKLAHNLSGAKLTSNLGGGFGSKNIFGGAGSENAPKFNANLAKSNLSIPKGKDGKLGAMKSNARTARGNRMAVNRAKTQRAFGQLKVARGLSVAGAGANSADAARAGAANAFDQAATTGGELSSPGIGTGPADTPSTGGGAPDVTSVPDVPDVQGVNGDPRMDQAFKGIEKMAEQAAKMKKMGMMMIAIGIILIAIGTQLTGTIFGIPIGLVLIALGIALMAMGYMMMQQAKQMADMAKQMGSTLAQSYGTGSYQEQAVNECTDQVLANGGGPCQRETYQPPQTTVQQDIEAERNTPVTMEGGPVP